MTTISIRIDDEVEQELEKRRGDINKSDFYRQIIDYYLKHIDDRVDDTIDDKVDDKKNDIDYKKDILITKNEKEIEYLRSENTKLLELLAREQALHLTTQQHKLLPEHTEVKKWYKFW